MLILASDYDGTIRMDNSIDPKVLQAIQTFRKHGNIFCIITGRSISMIKDELAHLHIEYDYLIGNNGGIIMDKHGEVCMEECIDFDKAIQLLHHFSDRDIRFGFSDGIDFCRLQNGSFANQNRPILAAQPLTKDELLKRKKINSFFIRGATLKDSWDLKAEGEQLFGEHMTFHYNNGTIDVSKKGVSKASGVEYLHNLFPEAGIHVIGDDYNDIDMIVKFNGYSVENAVDDVKKHASKIYSDVAHCIHDIEMFK